MYPIIPAVNTATKAKNAICNLENRLKDHMEPDYKSQIVDFLALKRSFCSSMKASTRYIMTVDPNVRKDA